MSALRALALALALAPLALAACASAPTAPAATPTGAVGQIDPSLAEALATYAGAEKVEVYVDRAGHVSKLSVYHHDAAKVPAPAQAAATREIPGATTKHFELERYTGEGTAHEIEVARPDGRECEVSLTAEGALRYVECKVPAAELPKAIAEAVAKLVPGGAIDEVEQTKGPKGEAWNVETKKDGVLHVLRFDGSGKLLSRGIQVPAKITVELR
jgi:hypothetical protein